MADPIPASVPPAPEGKPKAAAAAPSVPPILAPRKGNGRLWGIVDLVLLLAVAAGAAFYAMRETVLRHQTEVVDHPVGPLTHIRDGAAAPTVTTSPAP